ncbi:MAG TPA: ATP-binding protein [Candidatus Caccenecus avistercoris]|nr:ATP-binding protein [Candidatus Caccenecus avistercoris]
MQRFIMEKLIDWKNDKNRKPLILKGARQVGKTYILQEFGANYYENTAYFNFDHDYGLAELFLNTKDPKRIIEQLSLAAGKKINPNTTLIIFDEIQECPNALNSLKYFCEEASEYHVACAGSLLGIRLSKISFPVGKVDFLNLYPMTFSEFLIADGAENLVLAMRQIKEIQKIPKLFEDQLIEKLKVYYIIGGMPEAVSSWVNDKDIEKVNKIQKNILDSYENDFSKHTDASEANKISLIWNGIPSQLAKENKKFIYQVIKEGARAREYEGSLNWLNDANLISKCYLVRKCAFPLKAYNDLSAFKIYMNDVGLLRRMSNLDSKIILEGNKLLEEFKGAFTENYVANMLTYVLDEAPNYYTFDRNKIDFVIQRNNRIIPIEVKSNKSTNHNSLTKYNMNNDNEISFRFSLNNLSKDGKIINIPLYFIEYINYLNLD